MTVDVMPKPPIEEVYIGDGLYASYDGYNVCLRAPRTEGDHLVYLEPGTLFDFISFLRQSGFQL